MADRNNTSPNFSEPDQDAPDVAASDEPGRARPLSVVLVEVSSTLTIALRDGAPVYAIGPHVVSPEVWRDVISAIALGGKARVLP